ncbi:MAG TPA: potassium-transporting ATPase subunit C [Nitrososphaeraceae archaeon]|jgi:K+-transporting ATPase ATPase C chain
MTNSKDGIISRSSLREIVTHYLSSSLRIMLLMIVVTGIAYPIILVLIGEYTLPYQSTGSILTLNGKIIGSKLIAQEFKSAKFFHSRPPSDSASTVDPHITPENAFDQVSNVSKATGIPHNVLETLINLNIERNKITNGLFFAPQYVNVLEVNLDLVKQYPEHYQEFLSNLQRR